MNRYNKAVRVIDENKKMSDEEKIKSLLSLLEQYEYKQDEIIKSLSNNFVNLDDERKAFYWGQMVITVCAGIVTMATASKSLDPSSNQELCQIAAMVSGAVTAGGFGTMVAEELGLPIIKEDRMMLDRKKLEESCNQIKKVLESYQNKNQIQKQ